MVQIKTYLLKTIGGTYLTVQTVRNGLKLVAESIQQDQEPEVEIHEDTTEQIAFRFKLGIRYYSIKVDGTDLKVEDTNSNDSFTPSHWFRRIKVEGGEGFGLGSVGNPTYYLACMRDSTDVCLRTNQTDCVRITEIEKH